MKTRMKILLTTTTICCTISLLTGQVSFGICVGASPVVAPRTNHLIVNRNDPYEESLFNIEDVRFSGQLGLMVRKDGEHFWLMGELLYGQSRMRFSMIPTRDLFTERESGLYTLHKDFITLPVTTGVKLGWIEVMSGFFLSRDLHVNNEMTRIKGFATAKQAWSSGWLSGVGINMGRILFDVRYLHEFSNYGRGLFLHDQELILKNALCQVIVSTTFRI